jgi:hypothetical protein
MGVVVIPRVIFRLTPLAARQAVAPCRGHLRWSTALRPGSLVDGIRLCISISRCIDAASPPGKLRHPSGSDRVAVFRTPSQVFGSSLSGLSRQQRDRLLRAQPGTRLSADVATSSRLRHAPQATAPVCTRLLCLGLSRGPRPSDCFAGYIVHPCTRCSQGSPIGFICRMQMTTTQPSQGLVSRAWFAPMGSASRSYQL